MTSSPGNASMSRPSTDTVTVVFFAASGASDTSDLHARLADHRPAVLDVVLELGAEQLERRRQWRRCRGSQHADRRLARRPRETGTDVVGHIEQEIEVARASVPVDDAAQDALEPCRAFTARRALAAALLGEEAHQAP